MGAVFVFMMSKTITFDIITIFPKILESYLKESLLQRAQKKRALKIRVHNLRDWTVDVHKTVDDSPFGGGLGMVMKIDPIYKAVASLKTTNYKLKTILFTPRGKKFTQKKAYEYAKLKHIIMICGRYEGVDERVAKHIADEELSIGNYVLMGGEVPAMTVIETVARLIPGVVGKPQFLRQRSMVKSHGFVEYPQYTRPENFKGWKVPKVLLSGDHKKIGEWKAKHGGVIGA